MQPLEALALADGQGRGLLAPPAHGHRPAVQRYRAPDLNGADQLVETSVRDHHDVQVRPRGEARQHASRPWRKYVGIAVRIRRRGPVAAAAQPGYRPAVATRGPVPALGKDEHRVIAVQF